MSKKKLRTVLLPLLLALVLVVAGCAGPDDGTNETNGDDGAVGGDTEATEEGLGETTEEEPAETTIDDEMEETTIGGEETTIGGGEETTIGGGEETTMDDGTPTETTRTAIPEEDR